MTCSACGATLPDGASFCEECGRPVSAGPASPPITTLPPTAAAYGAIEGRPTSRTFAYTVVGVVLLAVALAGYWYYLRAEDRRLTEMDHPVLGAEVDALKAAAEPLTRLAAAAVPETKPEDYARLVTDAKMAAARYHEVSKVATPLPSGRPWPWQFVRCSKYLDDAVKNFPIAGAYLQERAKIKNKKPGATADIDQSIVNIGRLGGEPLGKLTSTIEELERQRADVAWVYEPKPRGPE